MFIVWGTKLVRTSLGCVADFCPLCRTPQAFLLVRLGMASHVYYISFGQGKLAGFERTCLQCRTVLDADQDRYKNVIKKYPFPHMADSSQLSHLTLQTFPDLREQYARRLELEHELVAARAELDPDQRHRLIKEPFLLLSPVVERRYAQAQFDMPAAATLAGGIAFAFAAGWLADWLLVGDQQPLVPLIVVGAIVAAIVALVVQLQLAKGRHLRRHVLPLIGKALRPLRPQQTELASVLLELKRMGGKLGKRVKPQLLQQYL